MDEAVPTDDPLDRVLPNFRADLEVYQGPVEGDGSPSYSIYDPLRAIYYKISWAEVAILQKHSPGMTLRDLLGELQKETTLRLGAEDVLGFFQQLESQGLIEGYRDPRKLFQEAKQQQSGWFKWFMLNYLFLKIPLFNPNRFLERTLYLAEPFMSKPAFLLYGILSVWGLALLMTRWQEFIATFPYFFNLTGIVIYSIVIVATKVVHELSHAYTAKKYGLRVPTIGVAFLLLWPVLYTDATDAWRLHSRGKRLLISAAGVIAECVMAGLATIGWAFSSPGLLHSVFFVVASVNWIATLVINLNPALRFDGYYLLSDLMGVENLQSRAFMVLRYNFYRLVAGAELPDVEPRLTRGKKIGLMIYAIYTWLYRIFLYTAIALFVYYKFTKVIGMSLFLLEIVIFFIWPIVWEFGFYQKIKSAIRWNTRLKVVAAALALFLFWFIVPLPVWVKTPAITVPAEDQVVYAPMAGVIDKLYSERGKAVRAGDPLMWIRSVELDTEVAVLEKEGEVLRKQLAITQLTDEAVPYYIEQEMRLAQIEAQLDGLRRQREQNLIRATVTGSVYRWDDLLREGVGVKINQPLIRVAPVNRVNAIAFVAEDEAKYIEPGQELRFITKTGEQSYDASVLTVSPVREQVLQFPQLSSLAGGDLAVVDTRDSGLKMVDSYYTVKLALDPAGDHVRFGQTGYVEFWGPWRSRALLTVEYVISIIISESGF